MKILVANIGSTSFKYRLLEMPAGTAIAEGRVERIGQPGSGCPDYATAIEGCLQSIIGDGKPLAELGELAAVGFKAVHARGITGAQIVDESVLAAMETYSFIAPAHNPPYIAAMRAFRETAPAVPLVALFETAFFTQLEDYKYTYAAPYEWQSDYGVRRYGFHGASHRYAGESALQICTKENLRHVSCHLGGSSSLAAIRGGTAIDVSFGMSPQSGIPQNNRVGDIDVFSVLYMMKEKGWTPDEMARILASRSGLAGISGISGDVRDLCQAADSGNERARLALGIFIYAIRHYLGSFMLELGGLDIITFSGGIGENSPLIRSQVCDGLEKFGVVLDHTRNAASGTQRKISSDESSVEVWVVPANEEIIVARAAADLVRAQRLES